MTTHSDLTRAIDAHLARAAQRVRARRLVVTLSVAGLLVALVGALAASWEALQVLSGGDGDADLVTAPLRPWLLLGLVVACGVAWTRGVSRPALARDVDRRLGLHDRTATALAIARGDVKSTLGERVLADTSASLDAAGVELERAFPARPRRAVLGLLRTASVLVAVWVAIVLASRLIGSGGGGRSVPYLPGTAPIPTESADGGTEGSELPNDPPTREPEPDPPPATEGDAPEPDVPEPDVPEPRQPPAGPRATAEIVMSSDVFSPGDDVLALAVAKPGAGLEAPAGFGLTVEIDGQPFATGQAVALDPGVESGALTPLRLARLPGAPEALRPGEHEAVLVLEPEGGGPLVRSEPQRFRIRGDEGGGDAPQQPPPEPQPQPQPEAPPTPEPQPAQPDEPGGDEEPPDEAEPPPLPENTERKVVVPLFGEGEQVRKIGPRLVLVPGGGPDGRPQRVPLEQVMDEARRRAESAVDRAGVRAEDRELVRRYFERLRRLAEGSR